MYSNSSLGATGRSLKIEDIESVSSYSGATDQVYMSSWAYYPNIFSQESVEFGRSEQSSYVTGYSEAGTLRGRETKYSYTMSSRYMNQKYVTLFNCSPASWLASRCISYDTNVYLCFYFSMFHVSGDYVGASNLYSSYIDISYGSASCAVRPVVEIDLTKVNVGATGTGAENDGYSLTLK